jgi:hypothetical protein
VKVTLINLPTPFLDEAMVVKSFNGETVNVLKEFIKRLEDVCPRKKIRDVVQRLEVEKV